MRNSIGSGRSAMKPVLGRFRSSVVQGQEAPEVLGRAVGRPVLHAGLPAFARCEAWVKALLRSVPPSVRVRMACSVHGAREACGEFEAMKDFQWRQGSD